MSITDYNRTDLDKALDRFPDCPKKDELVRLMEERGFEPYILKVLVVADTSPSLDALLWAVKSDDYDSFYCGDDWWADDFCAGCCEEDESPEDITLPVHFTYEGEEYFGTDYDCLGDFEGCDPDKLGL